MKHLPTKLRDHLITERLVSVANCNIGSELEVSAFAYVFRRRNAPSVNQGLCECISQTTRPYFQLDLKKQNQARNDTSCDDNRLLLQTIDVEVRSWDDRTVLIFWGRA